MVVSVYTYSLSETGPVLIHAVKYRPPFPEGAGKGFTGLQTVYERHYHAELESSLLDQADLAVSNLECAITQGAEVYRAKPIRYSLGDFVFDGFTEETANTGWLLHLTLDRRGVRGRYTVVVGLDERGLPSIAPHRASPYGDARSGRVDTCRMGAHTTSSPGWRGGQVRVAPPSHLEPGATTTRPSRRTPREPGELGSARRPP